MSDEEWRWGAVRDGGVNALSGRTSRYWCWRWAHCAASTLPHPPPSSCVVGDRIPETPEQTPPYLVFPLELAAEGRLATDYSALDDRGLDDHWLDDRWCDDRGLDDHGRLWGPGLVGLLAVLLHLDGATVGLRIGVGDRLLLDSRLWPPVILIDRVDAGGDGAADAADRQDDEEKNDQNYPAAMVRAARLVVAPAVVADSPGFAPAGIDQ